MLMFCEKIQNSHISNPLIKSATIDLKNDQIKSNHKSDLITFDTICKDNK